MKLSEFVDENLNAKVIKAGGGERLRIGPGGLRDALTFLKAIAGDLDVDDVFTFAQGVSHAHDFIFLTSVSLIECTAAGSVFHSLEDIERVEIKQTPDSQAAEGFALVVNGHRAGRTSTPIFRWTAVVPSEGASESNPEIEEAAQRQFETFKRLASALISLVTTPGH
jgi:hypothetical protein